MTESTEVRAEWPARVATVHVGPGDTVAAGQELVTLEAMKMLTAIAAPRDGAVAEVFVAVDDFVDQGAVLVRLH
ncbi:MAG: biotin/lipoyl-containing protein [Dehalococcoidia bacterium]